MLYPTELKGQMVGSRGFEPRNPKEQIYSLPRLTASLTAQKLMALLVGLEPTT